VTSEVVVADLQREVAHERVVLHGLELRDETRFLIDEEPDLGDVVGDGQDAVRAAVVVRRSAIPG
jgi:hypothetical protein